MRSLLKAATSIVGLAGFMFSTLCIMVFFIFVFGYDDYTKFGIAQQNLWLYSLVAILGYIGSILLCLWGIKGIKIINFLRMSIFPFALLGTFLFDEYFQYNLLYFVVIFVGIIALWNLMLSLWFGGRS